MFFKPGASLFNGKYAIRKLIAEGGFGMVYEASGGPTGTCAIKILSLDAQVDVMARARFERECELLKMIRHPHIVEVHDVGRLAGNFILVMELCHGSVADRISGRGRLNWKEVVEIGRAMCAALAELHARGIIHRDVKPSNILNLGEIAKLGDLGIAHLAESPIACPVKPVHPDARKLAITVEGQHPGTLLYMSPEQICGLPLTPASDVYSLTASLYEMLTGAHYTGHSTSQPDQLLDAILNRSPISARAVVSEVPRWIDAILLKGLSKMPQQRFGSCREMDNELNSWVGNGRHWKPEATRKRWWWSRPKHGLEIVAASWSPETPRVAIGRDGDSVCLQEDLNIESKDASTRVMAAGTKLPHSVRRIVTSPIVGSDAPTQMAIDVHAGSGRDYTVTLLDDGISDGGPHEIALTVDVEGDGRLNAQATDLNTGKTFTSDR